MSSPRIDSDSPYAVGRGGVDERPAGVVEGDELGRRLVEIGLHTPRHGAEAEVGDLQAAAADRAQVHAEKLPARRAGPHVRRSLW